TILITSGQGSFEPRKLTFDYNEDYEDTNLHYYVSNLESYRDKTVVICGGGDSAVDWALTLEDIAKKVYIVHRRDKFRAHEAAVTLMENSSIEMVTPYRPVELIGDEEIIHEVLLQERRGDKTRTLPLDYLIVNYGFVSDNRQLDKWGLKTEHASVLVNQRMASNIPGIYAAGDVATYDGKVKLIATGFGEAPTAINSIIQYLNPGQYIQAPLSADAEMADKFKGHFEDQTSE
ncbi:MAG TPA: NAD(P)/FAD-dependent oxidoreductase, partial [Atopostipes sp.]|nr:NAD(P)/FAD-dependent oxidoreductase [Atopostipes sp.]